MLQVTAGACVCFFKQSPSHVLFCFVLFFETNPALGLWEKQKKLWVVPSGILQSKWRNEGLHIESRDQAGGRSAKKGTMSEGGRMGR